MKRLFYVFNGVEVKKKKSQEHLIVFHDKLYANIQVAKFQRKP